MSEPLQAYNDYTRSRTGWFFGLSGPQLGMLLLAGLPGLAALAQQRWLGLLLWTVMFSLLVLLLVVPVKGRSATAWFSGLILHTVGGGLGWSRWQSKVAAAQMEDLGEVDLPGVLSGIKIHDGPPTGQRFTRVAIIQDHTAQTWAATARITHPGIGLKEPAARARMGAGLAELLENASRAGIVEMVSLTVRSVPDDGAERADWIARHRRRDAPPQATAVNDEIERTVTPAGVRNEAFFTLVVTEAAIGRPAKDAGGGLDGRARVLYGAMNEMESRLKGAVGCTEVVWLDSPALAVAVRTGFAPGDRAGLVSAGLAQPHDGAQLPLVAAGPTTAVAPRRYYQHDAWRSVSDTIVLPDEGAVMGALAPVLAPSAAGERRCFTVFYKVIDQRHADRETEREESSARTGQYLQQKSKRTPRARQQATQAKVMGLDSKLSKGRSLVKPSAVATVTVPDTWEVSEYARRLQSSIRGAGFTPVTLDLAQDAGFAAGVIPLGVGLRSRGWRR